MVDNALVTMPVLESRPDGLLRAVAAVRDLLGRLVRARRGDAGTLGDVVDVGSIVRVFDLDALRETTLIVAPSGWVGTSPGVVPRTVRSAPHCSAAASVTHDRGAPPQS
jgi:hypothetical protein